MLHPFDDLPLHQSSSPLMHLSSDSPGLYDRYFHNGHDTTGHLFFGIALGVYPNRQVMDASFSVVVDGVQHAVHASRHCGRDRALTTVGPIELTVVRPMLEHRLQVHDRLGVSADLTWQATSAVIEEPTFQRRVDGRPSFDYTRITQFGEWSGWIEVDGSRIELGDAGSVVGCRDRSWGIRNGTKGLGGPSEHRQFFWQWAPTTFDNVCTHLAVNEDAEGRAWHRSGAVTARTTTDAADIDFVLDEARITRSADVHVDVVWQAGTRWPQRATATLEFRRADPLVIVYEPLMRFQMRGIGYLHPEWDHGAWRGHAAETRERIDLAHVDPLDRSMLHVQMLCRATSDLGTGVGAFEMLAIGPHEPSGLTGITTGWG